jgi:hypothetical protein
VPRAREQEVVHSRQQEQRPSLGERCPGEECEHLVVIGHGPADGAIGGTTVSFDHSGEGPELLVERFLDQHPD